MAITKAHKVNFDTLKRACKNGDLALLECRDSQGVKVMVICAAQKNTDGSTQFIPLAEMFDGNPYDELIPPTV